MRKNRPILSLWLALLLTDLIFAPLTSLAYLSLPTAPHGAADRLVVLNLLKTLCWVFVTFRALRPVARANRNPEFATQALRRAPWIIPAGIALPFGAMFPVSAILGGDGRQIMIPALLLFYAVFFGGAVMVSSLAHWLLGPATRKLALQVQRSSGLLYRVGPSLRTRVTLATFFLTSAPVAWMSALSYSRTGGLSGELFIYALTSVIFVPIAAFLFSSALLDPIDEITETMERFTEQGEAEHDHLVPVLSSDEIGLLSHQMNLMTQKLADSSRKLHEALARLDTLYHQAQDALVVRDEFLALASHELKTPMTALSLQLQMLMREIKSAPNATDLARRSVKAQQQLQRLTTLVDGLVDVANIRTGTLRLTPKEIDLREVVQSVLDRTLDEAAERGSVVTFRAPEPVMCACDPQQIELVVASLISNAIRFGRGKPIEVELETDGSKSRIKVRDRGIGIPANQHQKIFERFERASNAYSKAGLGIGLFIANEVTRAHGGTLSVESEVGVGSTFVVELPARQPKTVAA